MVGCLFAWFFPRLNVSLSGLSSGDIVVDVFVEDEFGDVFVVAIVV